MKKKLFCIPYAGASAFTYNNWKKYLDDQFVLIPVELPGRGLRYKDRYYTSFSEAVNEITEKIIDQVQEEEIYFVFGHSLGCWLAYEVVYNIQMHYRNKMPAHLFLSGRYSPDYAGSFTVTDDYSAEEIEAMMLEMGGTPEEVFKDEAVRDMIINSFKNDYMLLMNYRFTSDRNQIECDISVMNGTLDTYSNIKTCRGWRRLVSGTCHFINIAGNHFYVRDNPEDTVCYICGITKGYLPGGVRYG